MCQISNGLAQIWHKFPDRLIPAFHPRKFDDVPSVGAVPWGFEVHSKAFSSSVNKRGSAVVPTTAQAGENRQLPNVGDAFNPYGMFNGIWVPEQLLRCSDLSASAKLLYGRLARFAGENGRCFPSVE